MSHRVPIETGDFIRESTVKLYGVCQFIRMKIGIGRFQMVL
jgi:hypothetical protein